MTSPAGPVNPVPIAYSLAKRGLSSNAALIEARALGVRIRDASWDQIYARVRGSIALQVGASAELLSALPNLNSIGELPTKKATGYIQYASVYVRDKTTGAVSTRPFAVRGRTLQTHGSILEKALKAYSEEAKPNGNYPTHQILGAEYGATQIMVPTDQTEE